jgi:hypothetical protein
MTRRAMRPSRTVNRKCTSTTPPGEFAFVVVDGGVVLVINLLAAGQFDGVRAFAG